MDPAQVEYYPNRYMELLQRATGGLALFRPSEVGEVGDCGYIKAGSFVKLFNVFSAPSDLEGIVREDAPVISQSLHNTGTPFKTSNVRTCRVRGHVPTDAGPFGVDVGIELSKSNSAAAFLAVYGHQYDVHSCPVVLKLSRYLLRNWRHIMDKYNILGYEVATYGLHIISGTTKVTTWCGGITEESHGTVSADLSLSTTWVQAQLDVGIATENASSGVLFTQGPSMPNSQWHGQRGRGRGRGRGGRGAAPRATSVGGTAPPEEIRSYCVVVQLLTCRFSQRLLHRIKVTIGAASGDFVGHSGGDGGNTTAQRGGVVRQGVGRSFNFFKSTRGVVHSNSIPRDYQQGDPDIVTSDVIEYEDVQISGANTSTDPRNALETILDSILHERDDLDTVVGDWSVIKAFEEAHGRLPDGDCIKFIDRSISDNKTAAYLTGIEPVQEELMRDSAKPLELTVEVDNLPGSSRPYPRRFSNQSQNPLLALPPRQITVPNLSRAGANLNQPAISGVWQPETPPFVPSSFGGNSTGTPFTDTPSSQAHLPMDITAHVSQPSGSKRPALPPIITQGSSLLPTNTNLETRTLSRGGDEHIVGLTLDHDLDQPPRGDSPLTPVSATRPQRRSRFSALASVTWNVRPSAQEVSETLEAFFPDHDIDKPQFETAGGGASPLTGGVRLRKTIRDVVREGRKTLDRTSKTTQLWGMKVEEVTPSAGRHGPPSPAPESPNSTTVKPVTRWIKGEFIGKGTRGKVFLALNANTGEMVAVKQIQLPTSTSDMLDGRRVMFADAIKSQSTTLRDLDHPNVVQCLGFDETEDYFNLFLEYVPGGSIGGMIRNLGKFGEVVAKSFTHQILRGLEYLHSRGIWHGDLKGDNVLVGPSGICKLTDFGIYNHEANNALFDSVLVNVPSSVFWMAPEMLSNAAGRGCTDKVDIWSLGCVYVEMINGRRPWEDEDFVAVMYKLSTREAPPVPELSDVGQNFMSQCFEKDPNMRPAASVLGTHPYLVVRPGWVFDGSFTPC